MFRSRGNARCGTRACRMAKKIMHALPLMSAGQRLMGAEVPPEHYEKPRGIFGDRGNRRR